MGIDVRFYYASLVAILLFFIIGLLVGIGVSRQPAVEKLAANIERQLKQYREEVNKQLRLRDERIRSLQAELAGVRQKMTWQEQFLRNVAPRLLRGLLQYRNIAIIVTAPDEEAALINDIKPILKAADGTVRSVTRIRRTAFTMPEESLLRLAKELPIQPAKDAHDIGSGYRKALIRMLARLIESGDQNQQLKKFVRSGWVALSGDYLHPIGAAVLISSIRTARSEDEFKAVDLELARFLKGVGKRVVICETSYAESSFVPACHHAGFSTVDNIETTIGQMCLVYAIAGWEGNYGWKETASERFPNLQSSFQASSR